MAQHRGFLVSFLVFTLAFVFLPVPGAWGHAAPLAYSITPNSVFDDIDELPRQLTITFTERPDPNISYIRVVDSENQRVDDDDFAIIGVNNRQAAVILDTERMQEGVYTVSWYTMSLDDGHITAGAYVFGIGDVTVEGLEELETTYITSYSDAVVKWPLIVAQSAVVGMAASSLALGKHLLPANSRRLAELLLAGSGTIAGAASGMLLLDAGNPVAVTGSYVAAIEALLVGSPAGAVWTIRIASAAAIGAISVAYLFGAKRLLLLGVIVAGAISIFSNSMLSHQSATPFLPELAVAADWVHFMAVSAWVGGLFYLSAVFVPMTKKLPDSARVLALSLPRFSLIATISLGIIGITGLYMAWLHLQSLDSLFETVYGNNLAVKLAAALLMILLGAYHQIRLHKGMVVMATAQGSGQKVVTTFGRMVKVEALLGIGVLLAASLLTVTSPPSQVMAVNGVEGYTHMVTIDDTDAIFEISPFAPGFNTFTVTLTIDGTPAENIHHVIMRFTNEAARIGPIIATLDNVGDGVYSTTGGYMSQEGEWRIDFIAQRTGAFDLNHSFRETLEAHDHAMHDMMHDTMHGAEPDVMYLEPELDSFAWLTIALAAAVAGGSAFYAIQSRWQMKKTLAALEQGR